MASNKYNDLFDETAPAESVFADKGALDPLSSSDEIIAREDQERQLATILNGIHEGYLPPTVMIHGPPWNRENHDHATNHSGVRRSYRGPAVEYVNLKECRTTFSAVNERGIA